MDAATLQDRIYGGYAKAAQRIGYSFDIYRSASAINPVDPSNKVGSLLAVFTPGKSGFPFTKTSDQKSALWNGLLDGRLTQPGDFLVNASHGTYFIAAQPDQMPILCMQCNHTISVVRSARQSGVGSQLGYAGDDRAHDVALGTGIPASIQFRREGQKGAVGLPGDGSRPTWDVFLPRLTMAGGAVITDRDYVVDEMARRYQVLADYVDGQGYYLRVERVEA